jgi:hypothetical protein
MLTKFLSSVSEIESGSRIWHGRVAAQRLTNGKTALAHWIGKGNSRLAKCKVLAPLLAASAIDDQFDTGGSQRRFA